MSIWSGGRLVGRSGDLLAFDDSNSLIQIAERHTLLIDADLLDVAAKYGVGTQHTIGGYAVQDAQEIAGYLAQVPALTSDEKTRLEERIIAEGSIFRER